MAVEARRLAARSRRSACRATPGSARSRWNTARHLSLYFAVPASGRVLHTINIRYFPEQVVYSINHAEDEAIFVDRSLLPLFAKYLGQIDTVRHIIVMDDGAAAELPDDPRILQWADVVDSRERVRLQRPRPRREHRPPRSATRPARPATRRASCTRTARSGCTPTPGLAAGGVGLTDRDNMLPIVPMFHAMAWGMPYTASPGRRRAHDARPGSVAGRPAEPHRVRAGHATPPASRRSGWACCRCSRAATCRPLTRMMCGGSADSASRCPRVGARRSASRSLKAGA